MKNFKHNIGMMLTGMALGAMLFGGVSAADASVTAQPAWSPIYVDGQQVQMTAFNIGGSNYVKLRDIGQAVGFNVYYQNGVQVDSSSPYTGEAPAQPQVSAAKETLNVASVKGTTLEAGVRSGLIIGPMDTNYTAVSSDPAVVSVELVVNTWVAVAHTSGTAVITVSNAAGETGSLTLTVKGTEAGSSSASASTSAANTDVDLTANMDIRQEMIRLINQTRRENGVAELPVNDALMNAAQDCSAQMFTTHHTEYECRTAMAYGYPYGFGDNLTWFTGPRYMENVAQKAVSNWIKSPGHFQTMIDPNCDCIGVGVTIKDGEACCYMFAGDSNSGHLYS